jgi:hypothetical protein
MWKQRRVRDFDERYDPEPAATANKPDITSKLSKYAPARGFESTICIAKTLIILWSIFIGSGVCTIIALAFKTGICCGVVAVAVLAVSGGVLCLIRHCIRKRKGKS